VYFVTHSIDVVSFSRMSRPSHTLVMTFSGIPVYLSHMFVRLAVKMANTHSTSFIIILLCYLYSLLQSGLLLLFIFWTLSLKSIRRVSPFSGVAHFLCGIKATGCSLTTS